MKNLRIKKIDQLLHQELSKIILKEFPKIIITVQKVKTAPDLKSAKVYISMMNMNTKKETSNYLNLLQEKSREFQNILAKSLDLKFIPNLHFIYDDSQELGERIDKILEKDKKNLK